MKMLKGFAIGVVLLTSFVACGIEEDAPPDPNPGSPGAGGAPIGAGGAGGGGAAGAGAGAGGAGAGGAGGAGAAGTGGTSGNAGTGGASGNAGTGGASGTAGTGGASGNAGTGGASGTAGTGGGGNAGTGGASGTAGTGGAGGASGNAGTGGASGSAGTAGTAGSAGASGGSQFVKVAGCDPAAGGNVEDHTADATVGVAFDGFAYKPACIRIKKGTKVTFPQSGAHPLHGMVANGTQPNPIHLAETGSVATIDVVFDADGSYGYNCANHGSDSGPGISGMSGAVYVE